MALIDWYVEGIDFGNCNCDWGCPCRSNRDQTRATAAASRRWILPWLDVAPTGASGGGVCHDGSRSADARPEAGLLVVRKLDTPGLPRHRPYQGADARHQRARRIRRPADLSRLLLCQRLQSAGTHLPRYGASGGSPTASIRRTSFRSGCEIRAGTRCRSAHLPPCAT